MRPLPWPCVMWLGRRSHDLDWTSARMVDHHGFMMVFGERETIYSMFHITCYQHPFKLTLPVTCSCTKHNIKAIFFFQYIKGWWSLHGLEVYKYSWFKTKEVSIVHHTSLSHCGVVMACSCILLWLLFYTMPQFSCIDLVSVSHS